jgi:hypothetical protein
MIIEDGYRVLMTHRHKHVVATGTIRLIPNETNYVMIYWDGHEGESHRVDVNYFTYDWIYVAKNEEEQLAIILKCNG